MKLGIVIAMAEELSIIKAVFAEKITPISDSIYTVYKTTHLNMDIFVIISGIGKVFSALGAAYLINNYKCDYMINFGVCGGVTNANVGDVIISNSTGYGDVDVTAFNYQLGQIPNSPTCFVSSSNTINFAAIFKSLKHKYPNIISGTITTSDSFIADPNRAKYLTSIHPNTQGLEMEAAGFAQACYLYKKEFILIKKVSDRADNKAKEEYTQNLSKLTQITQYTLGYLFDQISKST